MYFVLISVQDRYSHLWGSGVAQWLRYQATSREVPGSIPGGVTGDFFRGTPDRTMCPGVGSASESDSPGVKAAGAFGCDLPPLQCRNVKKIRGLNLPGTRWATSACRGRPLLFTHIMTEIETNCIKCVSGLIISRFFKVLDKFQTAGSEECSCKFRRSEMRIRHKTLKEY